jgi:hypothetical protein
MTEEVYRSTIAQGMFYVDGKPLSLEDYPMFGAIYDGKYPRLLLKTGRQVAKSTTLACFMIAESIAISPFKTFYISPSQEQTRKFSHTRVAKILAYSPDLRRGFVGPESIDNVLLRMLSNGSELAFTYALDDPDRARGYSADRCCFDEVQDILYEAVIPVIEECMAASKYQYSAYCGTPKTMENTIEFLWSQSTQTEWCMRCDGCNKFTFIDSCKAIGKTGPICLSCGKNLNPRRGQWVDMATDKAAAIKGFHISQAIMPMNVPAAYQPGSVDYEGAVERWGKFLYKMESPLYGESRFLNECIGVSTSTGVRLLTKEALEALCDESHEMTRLPLPLSKEGIVRTVAGVDWSGGGGEVRGSEGLFKSRTVLHISGQMPDGRLKTLYYKIFPNGHATGWIDEIVELCNAWGVNMLVGDAGEGALGNSYLKQRLGDHRVTQIRYMALSKPVDWNPNTLTYHADRTTLIDSFAKFLLHKQVVYPKLMQAKPAIDDILNVYEEVTAAGRKVWRHSPTAPDDCLHAQLFAWFAWMILTQSFRFS